ncbi:MAG: hypothetical protein LBJ63_10755 [Prevotellaceae bacterium]|jgi:natural product precursor|nr:hypothetical protein [Prevotellaceae bacterium]
MKKVKFKDLTGNKEVLKVEELSVLKGGQSALTVGCGTQVCVRNREVGAGFCTDGDGICASGIGTCTQST